MQGIVGATVTSSAGRGLGRGHPRAARHRRSAVRRAAVTAALLALLLLVVAAPAASAFDIPSAADPETWVTNGDVWDVGTGADGTVYLGGSFSWIGPNTGNGAPLDAGGAVVGTPANVDGTVWVAVPDGAGGFYIGGEFTRVGGSTRAGAARILADGSLDPAWDPGLKGYAYALAVAGDTVYIGGSFDSVGGVGVRNLAAVDAVTGTPDPFWSPDPDGAVRAVVAAGDTVYTGGDFTTLAGGASPRSRIAAVDAASGTPTAWDPDALRGSVLALALSPDGSLLYAGGTFAAIGGQDRWGIAALRTSGLEAGTATAWDPHARQGKPQGRVLALAVSGTTVYAGGLFSFVGGAARNSLAALDTTKDTDNATPWDPVGGSSAIVSALAISGTTLYVAGFLDTIGGRERRGFAALDTTRDGGDATAWDARPGEILQPVHQPVYGCAVAVSGTSVYAGGDVAGLAGLRRSNIAALDSTGVGTAWDPGADGMVDALAVAGDLVYAGGAFTSIGGQTRHRVAALRTDEDTGNATAWDPDADDSVWALAVAGDTVYAGGAFATIGGRPRSRIAALDAATGGATDWDASVVGSSGAAVFSLAVSGTILYAGGEFGDIGGAVRNNIAALDTEKDSGNATAWDPDATNAPWPASVLGITVEGGTVYVAGFFSRLGGEDRNGFAALDAATALASPWDPDAGVGEGGWGVAVADGADVVSGPFTSLGGVTRNGLAALDPLTGAAGPWDPDLRDIENPSAGAAGLGVAVAGRTVYAGGSFGYTGAEKRPFFAAFRGQCAVVPSVVDGPDGQPHGTIAPSTKQTVKSGGSVTFTFAPDPHYHVKEVRVGGLVVSTSPETGWTVTNVTGDTTISVEYALDAYEIVPSVVPGPDGLPHGTVSPATTQTVGWGATPTFTFIPDPGWNVQTVLVDGVAVTPAGPATSTSLGSTYTFLPVERDHTISVSFVRRTFAVSALASTAGGSVSPAGTTMVPFGDSLTVRVTAAPNHHVDWVTVDGLPVTLSGGAYTFTAVGGPHALRASFALDTYPVTARVVNMGDGRAHGRVSPAGTRDHAWGSMPAYTFRPDAGYVVFQVRVDGVLVQPTPRTGYTFAPLTGPHTLTVSFARAFVPKPQ